MPKPNDMCSRGRRAIDDELGLARSITSSSRLPEMYQITTLSPALIGLPPISASSVAVRRIWITGVCQRTISGMQARDQIADCRAALRTDRGTGSAPRARPTSSCASCRCRRPGTGSGSPSARAASCCSSLSPCARIEITSKLFGCFARSSQNSFMCSVNLHQFGEALFLGCDRRVRRVDVADERCPTSGSARACSSIG